MTAMDKSQDEREAEVEALVNEAVSLEGEYDGSDDQARARAGIVTGRGE